MKRPAGRNEIVSRFSSSAARPGPGLGPTPGPHRVDRTRGHNPFHDNNRDGAFVYILRGLLLFRHHLNIDSAGK